MTADELQRICDAHGVPVSLTGFIREADAAALLGVCARTLRGWRLAGERPYAVRLGGAWRYSLDELAEVLTPLERSGKTRQDTEVQDMDERTESREPATHTDKRSAA